jgi:hypothetical protein
VKKQEIIAEFVYDGKNMSRENSDQMGEERKKAVLDFRMVFIRNLMLLLSRV